MSEQYREPRPDGTERERVREDRDRRDRVERLRREELAREQERARRGQQQEQRSAW